MKILNLRLFGLALAFVSIAFFGCSTDNSVNNYYYGDDEAFAQAVSRTLQGYTYSAKEKIYGAFANQYSVMFKDYKDSLGNDYPLPVSVKIVNACEDTTNAIYMDGNLLTDDETDSTQTPAASCSWKKIMVKTWIKDFSDTGTVTGGVDPGSSKIFAPALRFSNSALLKLKAPVQTQIQIRAYALENDKEILFYSTSEPTTIYPMDLFGETMFDEFDETVLDTATVLDSAEKYQYNFINQWYGVWVTPNMDSIADIHNELSRKLPNGDVLAYQQYSEDSSLSQSTLRLVQAVYEVLQEKGINYVNDEIGVDENAQKIKYPIEVLRTRQADCIEGTFLFASILEAMGIEAYIVLPPDHAFLGWKNDPDDPNSFSVLETTMAWGETKVSFEDALSDAKDEYQEEKKNGNLKNGLTMVISVNDIRESGIMPNDIP